MNNPQRSWGQCRVGQYFSNKVLLAIFLPGLGCHLAKTVVFICVSSSDNMIKGTRGLYDPLFAGLL